MKTCASGSASRPNIIDMKEGHAGKGAHVVERGREPEAHPSDDPEFEDDLILELDPKTLACITAAEVNAFLQL